MDNGLIISLYGFLNISLGKHILN